MPITREFTFETSDTRGLRPVNMENADAVGGRTVAHDILEHFDFAGDPVENELQALGALYLLRFESGAQRGDFSIPLETMLARNVMDVLRELLEDENLNAPRRRRVYSRAELPSDLVTRAVGQALTAMDEEAQHEPYWSDDRRMTLHAHKDAIADWVLAGYQRAVARFACADVYTLGTTLFQDIAKKVDQVVDSGVLAEGDRVRISVDFHQLSVNIRVRASGYTRWVKAEQFC